MQVSVYNFCLFWASLFSLYLFVVFTKFMYFYNYRGEFIKKKIHLRVGLFFFFFFFGGGGVVNEGCHCLYATVTWYSFKF